MTEPRRSGDLADPAARFVGGADPEVALGPPVASVMRGLLQPLERFPVESHTDERKGHRCTSITLVEWHSGQMTISPRSNQSSPQNSQCPWWPKVARVRLTSAHISHGHSGDGCAGLAIDLTPVDFLSAVTRAGGGSSVGTSPATGGETIHGI